MSISLLTQNTEALTASACASVAAIVAAAFGSRTDRWATVPATTKYFHRHMNDPAARGGPS
jgi:hypothetical protein